MTRVHYAQGAAFQNSARRFQFDVSAGLVAHHLFGGSLGASLRNLTGGPSAEAVGTPVVNAGSLVLGPSGYIQAKVPESDAMTILAIARAATPVGNAGNKDIIITSTNAGPAAADSSRTSNGVSLYILGPQADVRTYNSRWDGTTQTSGTVTLGDNEAATPHEWAMYRTHFDSVGALLRDETAEIEQLSTYSVARNRTTNMFRIGMNFGSGANLGDIEIAQISYFNRKLTDPAEIAAHLAQMRALGQLRSIVV